MHIIEATVPAAGSPAGLSQRLKRGSPAPLNLRALHAFTLLELIVVIAVIAILAALLLPVLSSAKRRAIRAACMSNERQLLLELRMYADDYNDHLPPAGHDLDDSLCIFQIPRELHDYLTAQHYNPKALYDPGLQSMYGIEPASLWSRSLAGTQYDFDNPYIGYFLALGGPFCPLNPADQNSTMTPREIQIGPEVLPAPDPSTRPLVPGFVLSFATANDTAALRNTYQYSWQAIFQTWFASLPPGVTPKAYRFGTAHLQSSGRLPEGDNIGMLDGSVTWRKFEEMTPRLPSSPDPEIYVNDGFDSWW